MSAACVPLSKIARWSYMPACTEAVDGATFFPARFTIDAKVVPALLAAARLLMAMLPTVACTSTHTQTHTNTHHQLGHSFKNKKRFAGGGTLTLVRAEVVLGKTTALLARPSRWPPAAARAAE